MTNTPQDSNRNPSGADGGRPKAKRSLTHLSASQIAQRVERQQPMIARSRAKSPQQPGDPTAPRPIAVAEYDAEQPSETGQQARGGTDDLNASGRHAATREGPAWNRPENVTAPSASGPRVVPTGPRQMTIWEDSDDAAVIAGWVAASTRERPASSVADTPILNRQAGDASTATETTWRIVPVDRVVDEETRRLRLQTVTTHDDLHLVQRVRPAVDDLVLEHPYIDDETDGRLLRLGIRFGVWSLSKTTDGEFDPFRDLTEDRIFGFVAHAGVSAGSGGTYAAALRRLAAGPSNRHRGERRKAPAPTPRRVEEGLWAAADALAPTSWRHQEAKTLLALTFGAGALSEEINVVAPDDVVVDTCGERPRVRVRLVRNRTWVRDVPVVDVRYADWLASRAAQLAGQTYLFKPDRASRRNAVNATSALLSETNQAFDRFSVSAARSTWAVTWLRAGVSFAAWASAAGVGPGTHMPTDLLAYFPTPDTAEVDAEFRRSALRSRHEN